MSHDTARPGSVPAKTQNAAGTPHNIDDSAAQPARDVDAPGSLPPTAAGTAVLPPIYPANGSATVSSPTDNAPVEAQAAADGGMGVILLVVLVLVGIGGALIWKMRSRRHSPRDAYWAESSAEDYEAFLDAGSSYDTQTPPSRQRNTPHFSKKDRQTLETIKALAAIYKKIKVGKS